MGRAHVINHEHIPAACFTHPEIAMVGLTEEQAKARAAEQGFPLGKSVGHFRANSKALAELEADGIAKVRLFMTFIGALYHAVPDRCELFTLTTLLRRCCTTRRQSRSWACTSSGCTRRT
jgi:hypothetical protein